MKRLAPALLALLFVLSACSTTGSGPRASLARAEQLAARGDHEAAAREYLALATQSVGARATRGEISTNSWRLRAAAQWLLAARATEAADSLAALEEPLSSAERFTRDLLLIETDLVAGRTKEAWQAIASRAEPEEAADFERHHDLRQRAALATSRPLEAIRSERARERRASGDAARVATLRAELLAQLRDAAARGVKLDPRSAGGDAIARGWLEAAPLALRAAGLPASANRGITAAWQRRHPSHPALASLLATSATAIEAAARERETAAREREEAGRMEAAAAVTPNPSASMRASASIREDSSAHVAALLPLSGPQAAVGEEVRDGLVAAYLLHPDTTTLPLRFYDTASQPIGALIEEAVGRGARFVIGPLLREEVAAAVAVPILQRGTVPVLTLNTLAAATARQDATASGGEMSDADTSSGAAVTTFALAPEDEARALATHALAEQRRRAIALVPAGDWGRRVLDAFRTTFEAGGGRLLVTTTLSDADFSGAIESALRIDSSRARHRRVQSVIGQALAFQPRRRGDVDLLFIPGTSAHVRALRQQLKFEGAGDLPSFTTASAWDGRSTIDLENLVFVDMPWMLAIDGEDDQHAAAQLRRATRAADLTIPSPGRLYAFGHDAWLVQDALRDNALDRVIEGASGTLRIEPDGHVSRSLRVLELHEGVARPRTIPAP